MSGQVRRSTAAINSSLAGVYRNSQGPRAPEKYMECSTVFRGFFRERYIDLSEYITNELDAELLKRTPAAFLGSCRFKLPEIHEDKSSL